MVHPQWMNNDSSTFHTLHDVAPCRYSMITRFTITPFPLVLAEAGACTVFTYAPLPLVLADAATDTVFT